MHNKYLASLESIPRGGITELADIDLDLDLDIDIDRYRYIYTYIIEITTCV